MIKSICGRKAGGRTLFLTDDTSLPPLSLQNSPQMPQIIRNARTQSAEALSPFFLAEWLIVRDMEERREKGFFLYLLFALSLSHNFFPLSPSLSSFSLPPQGDTFNLIGCLLTGDQLQTMTYSAM